MDADQNGDHHGADGDRGASDGGSGASRVRKLFAFVMVEPPAGDGGGSDAECAMGRDWQRRVARDAAWQETLELLQLGAALMLASVIGALVALALADRWQP